MPFSSGRDVPPMGWVTTDPPPRTLSPMPPPAAGWGPSSGGARRCRVRRFRCNRPGHNVAECAVPPVHRNMTVPSQPASAHVSTPRTYGSDYGTTPYPASWSHGGSWPQEAPYGSGGYTSSEVAPPQPYSGSLDLMNNGMCALSSDPHLLTWQLAQLDKAVRGSV